MILVPTIPHTGTHFVRDHLLASAPEEIRCEHIYPNNRGDLGRLAKKVTTIVPLRHPAAVMLSWKQRGKPLEELPTYWRALIEHIVPAFPMFLPVDHPLRSVYLDQLNRHLRKRHRFEVDACDWPVLRDDGPREPVTLDQAEVMATRSLMDELWPFFRRFYARP